MNFMPYATSRSTRPSSPQRSPPAKFSDSRRSRGCLLKCVDVECLSAGRRCCPGGVQDRGLVKQTLALALHRLLGRLWTRPLTGWVPDDCTVAGLLRPMAASLPHRCRLGATCLCHFTHPQWGYTYAAGPGRVSNLAVSPHCRTGSCSYD